MESSISNATTSQELEKQILELVKLHHLAVKKESLKSENYKIHYAGRCYDENEVEAAVKNLLKFTLTYGKQGLAFERELANFVGVPNSFVVNSGSSANLVAISSLCSKQLFDEALSPGDEVIVPAASFPTTVAPIIQNGLIPVFVDTQLGFYNPSIESIRQAFSSKTRAVVFAHTLGNPAQIDQIKHFCAEKRLFLIEDCCDALGSKLGDAKLGTFGDLATYSFYPAHHITMGEGGAVAVQNSKFAKIVDSLRSWGKDCWCIPGETHCQGACRRRFAMKFGELPLGYDHKYIYTNIGYNLKPLDLQCAIGLEQLKKLSIFIEKRKYNFKFLYNFFKDYQDILILPQSLPSADPCWFAFPLTIKSSAGFTRLELTRYFEEKNIETRVLFAGNIVRQPAFMNIKCRISESLDNSDKVMHDSFFIGVYPGLTQTCLERITKTFKDFVNQKISKNIFLKKLGDSCESE